MPDTTQPISKLKQIIITSDALIDEAWEALERSEITLGKQLGQDVLDLSRSIEPPYLVGCAHGLIILAECARNEGQYGSAIAYVLEAELLYEDLSPDIWLVRGLYILGFSQEHLGNHTEALRVFHAQFDLAHEIDNNTYKATALRRIGSLHTMRNQPDLALEYFERCLELYDSAEDKTGLAGVYVNLSEIYYTKQQYTKALELAKQSLALHEAKGLIAPRTFSHSSLAKIYLAQGNRDLAEYHIIEALKFARQSERNYPQIAGLKMISQIRRDMKQSLDALAYLQEALELAIRADDLFERSECHRLLAETYGDLQQYDAALQHYKEFHQIRENLWNDTNKTRFESLEIMYQTNQARSDADTERQLREQQQHYYEKLSAIKDDIISTASHDLKNPLASLRLTIQILERHGRTDDEKGKELLERTHKVIDQMRDLITNVLDLARIETGKAFEIKQQDFVALIQDLLHGQHHYNAGAKNIELVFETELEKQNLYFDEKPIEQVINNLVSNAIKYTPENGKVVVAVAAVENAIETTVSDTGIGIPADDLPHIFDRFYRVDTEQHRSVEGTGLGLAICKSIIEQHGGIITVDSIEGQGSTFRFSLSINR